MFIVHFYFSSGKRDFGNSYQYNKTSLAPAAYELIININKGVDDELIFTRDFDIFPDPMSCGVYLRDDDSIRFDTDKKQLTVKFGSTGSYDSFSCTTNNQATDCKHSITTHAHTHTHTRSGSQESEFLASLSISSANRTSLSVEVHRQVLLLISIAASHLYTHIVPCRSQSGPSRTVLSSAACEHTNDSKSTNASVGERAQLDY